MRPKNTRKWMPDLRLGTQNIENVRKLIGPRTPPDAFIVPRERADGKFVVCAPPARGPL